MRSTTGEARLGKGYGVWRDACPLRCILAAKRGSDDGANKNAAANLQAA
ncbi:hypothetical protein [Marinibactrum halimedae]|nr:hypothetical protein [Marinibactrum halimedae]MCD9461251.1 hypothetical protein [Marinibactrum halimedae]